MEETSQGFSHRFVASAKRRLCFWKRDEAPPSDPTSQPPRSADGHPGTNGGIDPKSGVVNGICLPESEEEFNVIFADLVNELGLTKPNQDAMFKLPLETKRQIYCSHKKDHGSSENSSEKPDDYVEKINLFSKPRCAVPYADQTAVLERLRTLLRTQPMSFVMRFLELNGLNSLFELLRISIPVASHGSIHASIIGCIKNLMNSVEARAHVLAHPDSINRIAECLASKNVRAKTATLEILGAVCIVPGGHRKVLQAMTHFQAVTKERTRFQTLMIDIDDVIDDSKTDVNFKTAILSCINAMINCGSGQTHLEFRLHLRYEFLMLGMQSVIEKLRLLDNQLINRHLDFFEFVRTQDENDFAKRFAQNHIDSKSASAMFDVIKKKLSFGPAYQHLLSILFHLLQLPYTSTRILQYWQLVDRIIQQVALQYSDGDPDVAPLAMDVRKLLSQITNEAAIKETLQKLRDVEKENDEILSRLAKKERECEAKSVEKEELLQTLNNMRTKLDKDATNYQQKICQLTEQVEHLERQLLNAGQQGMRGSQSESSLSPSSPNDRFTPSFPSIIPVAPGGPPPPPPPPPPSGPLPPGVPPPPPPPPGIGMPGLLSLNKKNLPQPSQPMKSFNWTKLPENKLTGTIWTEISEMKVYESLDLEDFERKFSAYQKRDGVDLDNFGKNQSRARELTVIDGKRAQNCTIMLSKLKMSNYELTKAIEEVDVHDEVSKDMCEQLLKYVPTVEEVQMLNEHSKEIDQMAKADRFLFEMSRIDHYEERLKGLYYKKKYSERMNDTLPRIRAVLEASKEVSRSRCLRCVFEIILAFGNYMNPGQRGNAYGFRVSSLNKIVDTRSSVNKKSTLLHYLAEVIDSKYPNLQKLDEELCHVKDAASVTLPEVETEIGQLRMGLRDIEKEINYQRQMSPRSSYAVVMSEFHQVASCRFVALEDEHKETKQQFDHVVEMFGEEVKKVQPDEFFGYFDQFLTGLAEARVDNRVMMRQKEDEEKKAQRDAEKKAERDKSKHRQDETTREGNGEFDDMISALLNGDAFIRPMNTKRKGSTSNLCPSTPLSPETPQLKIRRGSAPRIDAAFYDTRERVIFDIA